MIFSILITIFALFIGFCYPKQKLSTWLLLALIYILFAFEHSSGDYEQYLNWYDNWQFLDTELLFLFLSQIGHALNLTFDQVRGFICLFEIIVIYKFVKDFSLEAPAVLAAFLIFPSFLSAELFRWLLGMSFVLLGLKYIIMPRNRKDYLIYFLCVTIAALSHSTCWFFLVYYLILIKSRNTLVAIVIVTVLLGVVFSRVGWFFDIFNQFFIRESLVEKYNTGVFANTNGLILSVIKSSIIVLMSWLAFVDLKKSQIVNQLSCHQIRSEQVQNALLFNERNVNMSIISLLTIVPIYFSIVAARIIHVPMIMMYIALVNKGVISRKKSYLYYPLALSCAYLFSALYIEGGSGPLLAFSSHFSEGYLIRFVETIFH